MSRVRNADEFLLQFRRARQQWVPITCPHEVGWEARAVRQSKESIGKQQEHPPAVSYYCRQNVRLARPDAT